MLAVFVPDFLPVLFGTYSDKPVSLVDDSARAFGRSALPSRCYTSSFSLSFVLSSTTTFWSFVKIYGSMSSRVHLLRFVRDDASKTKPTTVRCRWVYYVRESSSSRRNLSTHTHTTNPFVSKRLKKARYKDHQQILLSAHTRCCLRASSKSLFFFFNKMQQQRSFFHSSFFTRGATGR